MTAMAANSFESQIGSVNIDDYFSTVRVLFDNVQSAVRDHQMHSAVCQNFDTMTNVMTSINKVLKSHPDLLTPLPIHIEVASHILEKEILASLSDMLEEIESSRSGSFIDRLRNKKLLQKAKNTYAAMKEFSDLIKQFRSADRYDFELFSASQNKQLDDYISDEKIVLSNAEILAMESSSEEEYDPSDSVKEAVRKYRLNTAH